MMGFSNLHKTKYPLDILVVGHVGHNLNKQQQAIHRAIESSRTVRSYGYGVDIETSKSILAQRAINCIFLCIGPRRPSPKRLAQFISSVRAERGHVVFVICHEADEYWSEMTREMPNLQHYYQIDLSAPGSVCRQTKTLLKQCASYQDSMYHYDVAISCAGEDIAIARRLRRRLLFQRLKVFLYTEDAERLSGRRLSEELPYIYTSKSFCCVPILSSRYFEKSWTKRELGAAIDFHNTRGGECVYPLIMDGCEAPEQLQDFVHHKSADARKLSRVLRHRCRVPIFGYRGNRFFGNTTSDYIVGWSI